MWIIEITIGVRFLISVDYYRFYECIGGRGDVIHVYEIADNRKGPFPNFFFLQHVFKESFVDITNNASEITNIEENKWNSSKNLARLFDWRLCFEIYVNGINTRAKLPDHFGIHLRGIAAINKYKMYNRPVQFLIKH